MALVGRAFQQRCVQSNATSLPICDDELSLGSAGQPPQ